MPSQSACALVLGLNKPRIEKSALQRPQLGYITRPGHGPPHHLGRREMARPLAFDTVDRVIGTREIILCLRRVRPIRVIVDSMGNVFADGRPSIGQKWSLP